MNEARCYLCKYADAIVEREGEGRKYFIRCGRDNSCHEPCSACEEYVIGDRSYEEMNEFAFTNITGGMR